MINKKKLVEEMKLMKFLCVFLCGSISKKHGPGKI